MGCHVSKAKLNCDLAKGQNEDSKFSKLVLTNKMLMHSTLSIHRNTSGTSSDKALRKEKSFIMVYDASIKKFHPVPILSQICIIILD
jgi:hypothetical protein